MSRSRRSIRPSGASQAGYSLVELLVGLGVMAVAMATTTGLFVASRNFMMDQALQVETSQAVRASLDVMVRDLRLGGACLPINGDFISIDGTNNSTTDEIITRTGLIRPDLSCVVTSTSADAGQGAQSLSVEQTNGFSSGMRAYVRNTNATGEFFSITGVDSTNKTLQISPGLSTAYGSASGVYAIDERRYLIANWDSNNKALYMQLNNDPSSLMPFAIGIEQLDIQYQLERNCPPCDMVSIPADDNEWAIVKSIQLSLTARSQLKNWAGQYYRRTVTVDVKPRNLIPQ